MMSVLDKESVFGNGPAGWTSTSATSFTQYDEASVEQHDDNIQDDADLITGSEMVTHQEIARQSVRMTYTETRTKPHTVASMLGLTLGTIVGTQDGALTAYRQKITPATSLAIPSIAAQTLRENAAQYRYDGIKSESFELSMEQANPYIRSSTVLIGSGSRVPAVDAFPPAIAENWLPMGKAKLYLKNTAGTPITIPPVPSQTAPNLGGSEVDFSSRILAWTFRWTNNLQPDFWYRPGGGLVRNEFHPTRRMATVTLRLQVNSSEEATYLDYYFNQTPLALEMNLNTGQVVAATGVMFSGVILLIPRVQFRPITRGQTNQLEDLQLEARVMSDGTNPESIGFVYSTPAAYLL
jgi:hypothetical protein